jgi:hypothetical protein
MAKNKKQATASAASPAGVGFAGLVMKISSFQLFFIILTLEMKRFNKYNQ